VRRRATRALGHCDALVRLVEQSLVCVETHLGLTRYRFLETVRAYATERLEAAGEAEAMKARHRTWRLDFVERAADGLSDSDQVIWLWPTHGGVFSSGSRWQ
jgi:predicted ATPase